jgi:hypothetical protein
MRKRLLVIAFLIASLSLGSQNPGLVPVGQSGDWTLLFSDDFDGQSLDVSRVDHLLLVAGPLDN